MQESQFIRLWQAYLTNSATPEELIQLMEEIKSGRFDSIVKDDIGKLLYDVNEEVKIPAERANALLYRILDSENQNARIFPIERSNRSRWKIPVAVAASLLIVLVNVWIFRPNSYDEVSVAKKTQELTKPMQLNEQKQFIRLIDGTTVLLNNGSKILYQGNFNETTREVTLIGEAYFDVTHNPSKPFIVHSGKLKTTVLGTAFNIKAFPEQSDIVVTVTRGKVKVVKDLKTLGIIAANEQILFNKTDNSYLETAINAETVVKWKKNYLVLDNVSMEEAATMIGSKYNVEILFANEKMKECYINATFLNNESLEQVLKVITTVLNAKYTIQPNDQVILKGEGCN